MQDIFSNSGLDCSNYSQTLMGWAASNHTPNNINLGSVPQSYQLIAAAARDSLVTSKDWTIADLAPIQAVTSKQDITCYGGLTGSITALASGGAGNYRYQWNTQPIQATATATGLNAGSYTFTITDSLGCTAQKTVNISQPAAALTARVSPTAVSCYGAATGTAAVNAMDGWGKYSYSWNTQPAQNTAIATGLAAGSYVVTITDSLGCQLRDTVSISQPAAALTATVSPTAVICYGAATGTAAVNAMDGWGKYSYSWNTQPAQNTAIATGLAAGNYAVTITDSLGCQLRDTVSISQPSAALTATLDPTAVICYGTATGTAAVNAVDGWGKYSYTWNTQPVQTSALATGLAAGSYAVTITDSLGCMAQKTVSISQPSSALTATLSPTAAICYRTATGKAAVNVAGGWGKYSYNWATQPVQTTALATGLAAGSYAITITDSLGCQLQDTAKIGQPASITVTHYDTLDGLDPYIFGSQSLRDTGTYSGLFQSVMGCDSAVTLHLGVRYFNLSGTVHHNADGLLGNPARIITGSGTNAGALVAVLISEDSNGVVATVPVLANGHFSFTNIIAGHFRIRIHTTANANNLDYGWVYTGHQRSGSLATNPGDGQLRMDAVIKKEDDIRFGIQRLPLAAQIPIVFHLNPAGTEKVTVSTLLGTDQEDGNKGKDDDFIIKSLPPNGKLYYNNLLVHAGDTLKNYQPELLQIDPDDGATVIRFAYNVLDNAGFAATDPGSVAMSFIPVPLAGNVLHDANGLSDNLVNGSGYGMPSGVPLYVNITDPDNDKIMASVQVASDGTYSFPTVQPDKTISISLSMLQGEVGYTTPARQLPVGWVYTGQHYGAGPGYYGLPDGNLQVFTGLLPAGLQQVNFGIEQPPTTVERFYAIGSVPLNLPFALTAMPLSGTDPEEGNFGAGGSNFIFGQQPACCAYITYAGQKLGSGTVLSNYDPALLAIVFTDIMATNVFFTYTTRDAAGYTGNEARYTFNTGTVLPLQWGNFEVIKEGKKVRLDWNTITETNNTGFSIERSADGSSWKEITFVPSLSATGNSNEVLYYTHYDTDPVAGMNFYRLKQIDKDSIAAYSVIRKVQLGEPAQQLSIYPNPATDKVYLKGTAPNQIKSVHLLDAQGRIVYQAKGNVADGVPLKGLAQGVYMLQVEENSGQTKQFKVVKD